MGFIMLTLVPICLGAPYVLKRGLKLQDRLAIPILYAVAAVSTLLLVKWPGMSKTVRIVLFSWDMLMVIVLSHNFEKSIIKTNLIN